MARAAEEADLTHAPRADGAAIVREGLAALRAVVVGVRRAPRSAKKAREGEYDHYCCNQTERIPVHTAHNPWVPQRIKPRILTVRQPRRSKEETARLRRRLVLPDFTIVSPCRNCSERGSVGGPFQRVPSRHRLEQESVRPAVGVDVRHTHHAVPHVGHFTFPRTHGLLVIGWGRGAELA